MNPRPSHIAAAPAEPKPDPWLLLTQSEKRVANLRYQHKLKLAKIDEAHATILATLRTDLDHLETDIRAGRTGEKLIDAINIIRSKTPLTPAKPRA